MKQELNLKKEQIIFGKDSIVIRKYNTGFAGGRTLDCTGISAGYLNAGHVVIKTADGNFAPMPVAEGGTAYAPLPEGASYVGVLAHSLSKEKPAAAIMYDGVVNPECVPYPMDGILAAFTAAVPHIIFEKDEEA